MSTRRALIVGIDKYPTAPLKGCVADARAMDAALSRNGDDSPNFSVKTHLNVETRAELKTLVEDCFADGCDIALFYYSGHGGRDDTTNKGYLVTPDCSRSSDGLDLDDILAIVIASKVPNKVIFLDSCYSGQLGAPGILGGTSTLISEGLTMLSACRATEGAIEEDGRGVFTKLLVEALQGGAADITGHITPGGVYAYIDKALGPWDQRPVFKTNVTSFVSLRNVIPQVPVSILRKVKDYFETPTSRLGLDPSFEPTNKPDIPHALVEPYATEDNTKIFSDLQKLEGIGLVRPVGTEHMYFAAMESLECELTAMGQQYWRLASTGKI